MEMTFREYLDYEWDMNEFIIGRKTKDNIQPVPRGRDFRSIDIYLNNNFDKVKKEILCYGNFSPTTHKHRKRLYKLLKDEPFILFENMDRQATSYRKVAFSDEATALRENFYEKMSKSKFVLSPRGNGVDCFRTWDALYMKTIPIVKKHECMMKYSDLPIMFVENYSILTAELLEDTYNKMLDKEYNFEKLFLSYWREKILENYVTVDVSKLTDRNSKTKLKHDKRVTKRKLPWLGEKIKDK